MKLPSSASRPLAGALLAFLIYQVIALVWFGRPVLNDFSHSYIGIKGSPDPGLNMWFLVWWPYAISHHINPLLTKAIWAPSGFNLTWATSIPFAALIAAPVTLKWGPVVSWNILCLLAPAVAAWCAFILCRHVCKSFVPALAGGYVFGFSPYMLGHLLGHLCMILVFPVPLAIYLVVLRLERRLAAGTFVALLALAAVTLFLCSQELLATAVLFGAIALLTALATAAAPRTDLLETGALAALALAVGAVLLAPYFYYLIAAQFPRGPINSPQVYSSDLLAFLVPGQTLLLGELRTIRPIALRLTGGGAEDTAYLGLPLLVLIFAYGWRTWRTPSTRLTLATLLIIMIASLGPVLHVAGAAAIRLPWALFIGLPLIDKALPGRFMMYAFLDAGLILSLYLAAKPGVIGKSLALLAIISLIPDLPGGWWFSSVDTPRFFRDGGYRSHLTRGETTLVLPYGREGNSMLWQAQSGMYFRMAGGYVGLTPTQFLRWPVLNTLYNAQPCLDFAAQLKLFLAAHDVKTIIVAGNARRQWPRLLQTLDLAGSAVDDVTLYDVPEDLRSTNAGMTAEQVERDAALHAFALMISAAQGYWARGLPLSKLNPWEASRLGLLSLPAAGPGPDPHSPQWWQNLWLGEYGDLTVGVGTLGDYAGISGVIERYGPLAKEVFFPYPRKLRPHLRQDTTGQLLMTFDRRGLERALAEAQSSLHP